MLVSSRLQMTPGHPLPPNPAAWPAKATTVPGVHDPRGRALHLSMGPPAFAGGREWCSLFEDFPIFFSCPAGFANERWFSRSGSHDTHPNPARQPFRAGRRTPHTFHRHAHNHTSLTTTQRAADTTMFSRQHTPHHATTSRQHTPSDMDDHYDSRQPRTTIINTTNTRQQTTKQREHIH